MSLESVLYILFTIGGATTTLYFLREAKRGLDSESWPSTNGTVISSKISSGYYETEYHSPENKYEYTVMSQKFSNNKLAFFNDFGSSSKRGPERIRHSYRVRTQVKVYYHPSKPELSVLIPGLSPNLWSLLFFGIGLLLFIIGLYELIG